ncbi:MAG: DUF4422 domain-containing protein [Lachnospiraceae bacterium]|nr:DUF4422 domain-containing protein [Lachnospiraceae bacterium]
MDLVIFGAQGYALGAYKALKALYPRRVVPCFLVTEKTGNADMLGDIPVRELKEFAQELSDYEKKEIEILIATPENVQSEIEEILENWGFPCHKRLDSGRWNELMKLFHTKMGSFQTLASLPVGFHMPFVRMYMAKSDKDRPLQNAHSFPAYTIPVQAGAAGSNIRIADLLDNRGDNISSKNGNYSELTVLYWIWKNKLKQNQEGKENERQYYGLMQYRRIFEFSDDDLLKLVDNHVDVVLPYPMPYEPDIHSHHKRYLRNEDWDTVLFALRELAPDCVERFSQILEQQYFYNYNVILAKKPVLREYCQWLFPILEKIEECSIPRGYERRDRYIGYIGETLETLYFMKNADRLNIVHTGCKLLI